MEQCKKCLFKKKNRIFKIITSFVAFSLTLFPFLRLPQFQCSLENHGFYNCSENQQPPHPVIGLRGNLGFRAASGAGRNTGRDSKRSGPPPPRATCSPCFLPKLESVTAFDTVNKHLVRAYHNLVLICCFLALFPRCTLKI